MTEHERQSARRLYRRLILSWWDFFYAHRFAERLREHQEGDTHELDQLAATIAAVVSYTRPFSANHPTDNTAPGLPKAYLGILNKEDLRLHENLLRTRHEEFAHSDAEVRDLSVRISEFQGEKIAVPLSRDPMVPLDPKMTQHLLRVLEKLMRKISRERTRLEERFEVGEEL